MPIDPKFLGLKLILSTFSMKTRIIEIPLQNSSNHRPNFWSKIKQPLSNQGKKFEIGQPVEQ